MGRPLHKYSNKNVSYPKLIKPLRLFEDRREL